MSQVEISTRNAYLLACGSSVGADDVNSVRGLFRSYKTVKGRSHTVEERNRMHSNRPYATSQPSLLSHTHSLTAQLAQPLTAPRTRVPS